LDKGIDNLNFTIREVMFVQAQLLRFTKVDQEKVPESPPKIDPDSLAKTEKVPPVAQKSESFPRIDPGLREPAHPDSSLMD